MSDSKTTFVPLEVEDYYPKVVKRLLKKILKAAPKQVVLYGFSDNMKWLLRLLQEQSIHPVLTDWRDEYKTYDCGGKRLVSVDSLQDTSDIFLVVCVEEINQLKDGIKYLYKLGKNNIRVIYDRTDANIPLRQEHPYKDISARARARATSMMSDPQLFDLIQFIENTKDVPGDVVEYGALHGGSGAVLAEAVKYFGEKPVWLFDL